MTATITADAEKLADLTAMRRATDPVEKLRRASEAIELAQQQIEPRRLLRNAAAVILYREGQKVSPPMQPAAMWRDTINVSRSLWHKIMDEADPAVLAELRAELAEVEEEIRDLATERAAEITHLYRERDKLARKVERHTAQVRAVEELTARIAEDPEFGKGLLQVAREVGLEVRRLEALIPEATKVRDEMSLQLINGVDGQSLPNATVAKLAKVSTARVAQLRKARILM